MTKMNHPETELTRSKFHSLCIRLQMRDINVATFRLAAKKLGYSKREVDEQIKKEQAE